MSPSGNKRLLHPAKLMFLFWGVMYGIYFMSPLVLRPAVSWAGFGFVLSNLLVFAVGTLPIFPYRDNPDIAHQYGCAGNSQLCHARIERLFMVIGIFGLIFSILGKLALLGEQVSLSDLYDARSEAASNLLDGVLYDLHGKWLSAIAFLLYPAGFIAVVSFWIRYEDTLLFDKVLAGVFGVGIIALSVLAGGRSGIFILMVFILCAGYVRTGIGKAWIPNSGMLKLIAWATFIGFLTYSSLIWTVRAHGEELSDYLARVSNDWGLGLTDGFLAVAGAYFPPDLIKTIVNSIYYLIQNLSVTERVLSMPSAVILYGSYQIDLIAALFRMDPDLAEYMRNGYSSLLEANVYGFFSGAWTGLYLDIGLMCYVFVYFWGSIAGVAYRNLQATGTKLWQLIYAVCVFTIFISFVSSPFGHANSFVTLIWLFLFVVILNVIQKYPSIPQS